MCEWAGKDSNLRRLSRQIYSLLPLAGWVPTPLACARIRAPESYRPRSRHAPENRNHYSVAMPSFDIVSEVDRQEVRNAIDQAQREINNRFDFKNTNSTIEHNELVLT